MVGVAGVQKLLPRGHVPKEVVYAQNHVNGRVGVRGVTRANVTVVVEGSRSLKEGNHTVFNTSAELYKMRKETGFAFLVCERSVRSLSMPATASAMSEAISQRLVPLSSR